MAFFFLLSLLRQGFTEQSTFILEPNSRQGIPEICRHWRMNPNGKQSVLVIKFANNLVHAWPGEICWPWWAIALVTKQGCSSNFFVHTEIRTREFFANISDFFFLPCSFWLELNTSVLIQFFSFFAKVFKNLFEQLSRRVVTAFKKAAKKIAMSGAKGLP